MMEVATYDLYIPRGRNPIWVSMMRDDHIVGRPVRVKFREMLGPSKENQPRRGLSAYQIEWVSGLDDRADLVRIEDIAIDPIGRIQKKKRIDAGPLESEDIDIQSVLVRAGDLVLTTQGPPFKCAVADEGNEGLMISENIIAVTLLPGCSAEYVASYLNSPLGQNELKKYASGSTHVVRISPKALLDIEICLPREGMGSEVFQLFRTYYEYERLLSEEREARMRIMDALLCVGRGGRL